MTTLFSTRRNCRAWMLMNFMGTCVMTPIVLMILQDGYRIIVLRQIRPDEIPPWQLPVLPTIMFAVLFIIAIWLMLAYFTIKYYRKAYK